jgi:hypothetical protein
MHWQSNTCSMPPSACIVDPEETNNLEATDSEIKELSLVESTEPPPV